MKERKLINIDSPDLSKMQAVVIDKKTTIYIARSADPDEARMRYLSRNERVKA